MYLKRLYQRLISDIKKSTYDDDMRIQIQYRYILKILVLVVGITSIINLLTKRYTMGILMFILGVTYFLFYQIVYHMKGKGAHIVTILMNILSIPMCIIMFINGATSGFATLWILMFPILVFLLTGKKAGLASSLIIFTVVMFLFWTSAGRGMLRYEYSPILLERYPLVFLVMIVISFFYEILRSTSVAELRRSKSEMESIYQNQYSSMHTRIAEAKKVRHDLRHHFVMLNQYLEDGKIEEAKSYIDQYYSAIPFEEALTYCEHYNTNALLTYYGQLARQEAIPLEIAVNFPTRMPVNDEDLTVIIGNLFENAVHACIEGMKEEVSFQPYIKIKGNFDGSNLLFSNENASLHEAKQDAKKRYISSKHEGNGIGISSVKSIAEKYRGTMKIEQNSGMFRATVIMLTEEK